MVINIMNALRARGIGVGSKLEGTALAGDVRKDETFMNADGGPVTGTLVTRDGGGPVAVTPGTATQTLLAGIYDNNISIAGDADLTPGNLRDTANVFGVVGTYDHSAVPIAAANVLAGKEGFVNGVKVTGTMVDRGAVTITPGTIDQAIAAGYHNGAGKVLGDIDLAAGNVRDLVNIFGVIGNYDHSAVPITAANVIAGKEGFVNGVKVTGTMVDKVGSGTVITPSTVDQAIPAGRYGGAVGDGKVLGDADLVGSNILSGKNIFGVDGTLVLGTKFASGVTMCNSSGTITITGLDFTPSLIVVEWHYTNDSRATYLATTKNAGLNLYYYIQSGTSSPNLTWSNVGPGTFTFDITQGNLNMTWAAYE